MRDSVLASWNEGEAKRGILDFVQAIDDGQDPSSSFRAERIATFDNDGTLWVEQPMPPQFDFVFGHWAEEIKADPSLAAAAALQGDHRKGPGVLRRAWRTKTPR